jgi:hypothetical protein
MASTIVQGFSVAFVIASFLFVPVFMTVLWFVVQWVWGKIRHNMLAGFASANGWSFTDKKPGLTKAWKGDPFQAFGGGRAKEVFEGTWHPTGHQFMAFDYERGKGRLPSNTTVFRTRSSSVNGHFEVRVLGLPRALPSLAIAHESFGDKVGKAFGGQDIEFESDNFNRAYRVTSDDPRFAYSVITPQLIEWLLGPGRALVPLRIEGNSLITFEPDKLNTSRFPERVALMAELASQIPQHVWDIHGR